MVDNIIENWQNSWEPGAIVNWDENLWGTKCKCPYGVFIYWKPNKNGELFYEETSTSPTTDLPYLYDVYPYMSDGHPTTETVAQHFVDNWKGHYNHVVVGGKYKLITYF